MCDKHFLTIGMFSFGLATGEGIIQVILSLLFAPLPCGRKAHDQDWQGVFYHAPCINICTPHRIWQLSLKMLKKDLEEVNKCPFYLPWALFS